MNHFYVYVLFDFCGIPRYIGKGRNNRWLEHERYTDPNNTLKNEFIERTWIILGEIPKIKVREDLTQDEAFALEIILISLIGRLDIKTGPLTNLTAGGDGFDSETSRRVNQIISNDPVRLAARNAAIKLSLSYPDVRERLSAAIKIGRGSQASRAKTSATNIKRLSDPIELRKHGRSILAGFAKVPERMKEINARHIGTIWVKNIALDKNKRISKNEAVPKGWEIGKIQRRYCGYRKRPKPISKEDDDIG